MRVAFDIGGVLSKYPEIFKAMICKLGDLPARRAGNASWDVFIISDMPKPKIIELLTLNGLIEEIAPANIYSADYDQHGEGCKAVLLHELGIDLFFDDFIGYTAVPAPTVRCLLMPNAELPYYADSWKLPPSDEAQMFGRRRFAGSKKGRDA